MALAAAAVVRAAEPVPVLVRTAPGRFEISAVDSARAHALATEAEAAWRELTLPFELPAAFPTPIYVRAIAGAPKPFAVTAEVGGIVSVRLDDAAPDAVVRRALVQGLLLRVAVSRHGVNDRLRAPRWLVEAGAGWWLTRAEAAQLDALKQGSEARTPPSLADLLQGRIAGEPPREFSAASVWLLTFLQAESGRARDWPNLLTRLLRGDDPEIALAACYGDRFGLPADRELWWQVGWHHAVRARTLPVLSAAESRVLVGALARFVFAGAAEETDVVVPLPAALGRAEEPIVAAELARRAAELSRAVPTLHPFYRNSGLSLAEAFASRGAKPDKRAAASSAFAGDWRDALELEAATTAALDALEKR
ncbi:MAG: hypothetical protein JNL39_19345 [Opitutaceae bacterium]|nr:hypothetical protein [Opitutaceae bacterium]